jgi:hypothetical protein
MLLIARTATCRAVAVWPASGTRPLISSEVERLVELPAQWAAWHKREFVALSGLDVEGVDRQRVVPELEAAAVGLDVLLPAPCQNSEIGREWGGCHGSGSHAAG